MFGVGESKHLLRVCDWMVGEILKFTPYPAACGWDGSPGNPEIPVMKKARTCEKALSQTNKQTLGKIQPTN